MVLSLASAFTDAGRRKLRLLMTRLRISLSAAALGAKSLAAGRAVLMARE
jgi:hypothetical protein